MNIKSIFSKIFKGEQGEADVLEAIGKILNQKGDENYYLIQRRALTILLAHLERSTCFCSIQRLEFTSSR